MAIAEWRTPASIEEADLAYEEGVCEQDHCGGWVNISVPVPTSNGDRFHKPSLTFLPDLTKYRVPGDWIPRERSP